MQPYIATPISRKDIRRFAEDFRKLSGMGNRLFIDIVYIVEVLFREVFDPELNFIIAPASEMGNQHGLTNPAAKTIKIREDVYDGACEGRGRDRFTIAHELGHYIMHDEVTVGLARLGDNETIKPYRDPEWQANAFAGELLIPHDKVIGLSPDAIARSCGVSLAAATFQRKR